MKNEKFPTPENIFKRFCEQVPKFGSDITDSEWSRKLFKFFHDWGVQLGYHVYCKKEYGNEAKGEYLGIDMLWAWESGRAAYMQLIDVILENENQDTWENVLNDEVQKLISVKAILKVLIYYIAEKNLGEFVDRLRWYIRGAFPKIPEEKYLIILGVQQRGDYNFYGYIFDNSADLMKQLEQHVSMPT